MTAVREMVEEMVDDILDQEGPITIGGSVFYRSSILREMDPTAYREMLTDMADSLISDLQDELESTDDQEEKDEIQERIDMLESI